MENNNKSLSKMNKKELYVECKKLRQDNMKLQLFQDDNLIKENVSDLIKDNNKFRACAKYLD